ncbi:unnamed protein product, partial [Prunus brigantina]
MERDQAALREGLESEESDARQSTYGSTRSRRSMSGSRRLNQIQEAFFIQGDLEKFKLDRGDEPFPSKNMRPQYIQKALHQRRNHPDFEEEEEHREEVLPRPCRVEQMIEHNQPKQGRNLHPVNALNEMGALQRMIREMMEPDARRGERPTYRKPYPAYID